MVKFQLSLQSLLVYFLVCQSFLLILETLNVAGLSQSCKDAIKSPSNVTVNKSCIIYQTHELCQNYTGGKLVRGNETILAFRDSVVKSISQYLSPVMLMGNSPLCMEAMMDVLCHSFFPPCVLSSKSVRSQPICLENCEVMYSPNFCGKDIRNALAGVTKTSYPSVVVLPQEEKNLVFQLLSCTGYPSKSARAEAECYLTPFWKETQEKTRTVSCYHGTGIGYLGDINQTESAKSCQSWQEQCPHRHLFNDLYQNDGYHGNQCRNPSGLRERPWCYTTNSSVRWEYCDVVTCNDSMLSNDTEWTQWTACSASCDKGQRVRTRYCSEYSVNQPDTLCVVVGVNNQTGACKKRDCSVDGGYTHWSVFTSCNVSCGDGYQQRKRFCSNPLPSDGGKDCSSQGHNIETRECRMNNCTLKSADGSPLDSYQITALAVGVSIVLAFAVAIAFHIYRQKRLLHVSESIEAEYDTFLDADKIRQLQRLPDEEQFDSKILAERLMHEARIYQNISNYESVKDMLRQMYIDNFVQTSSESFLLAPSENLKIRKIYEDWMCYYHKQSHGDLDVMKDIEQHLTEWVTQCVEYSRLSDASRTGNRNGIEDIVHLVFGAFDERGNALYDRLDFTKNKSNQLDSLILG